MGNQTTKSPFDVQILAARLKDLMRESVPKVTQKDLAAALGTGAEARTRPVAQNGDLQQL